MVFYECERLYGLGRLVWKRADQRQCEYGSTECLDDLYPRLQRTWGERQSVCDSERVGASQSHGESECDSRHGEQWVSFDVELVCEQCDELQCFGRLVGQQGDEWQLEHWWAERHDQLYADLQWCERYDACDEEHDGHGERRIERRGEF